MIFGVKRTIFEFAVEKIFEEQARPKNLSPEGYVHVCATRLNLRGGNIPLLDERNGFDALPREWSINSGKFPEVWQGHTPDFNPEGKSSEKNDDKKNAEPSVQI